MHCHPSTRHEAGERPRQAMTLIEMIGVLAIVAILAALSLTFTVRHLDQIASDKEVRALASLGGALENSILRTREIPDATQWASRAALEAGMDLGAVTNNFRRCRRVLWYDPSGWLPANVPYTQTIQTATNMTAPPTDARLMLVSTIAGNLPITSGMAPSAPAFADLWNCTDGTIPSGWTGVQPDDVKVHRVNLSPLFVRLVLGTYFSNTNGQYGIDLPAGSPPSASAPFGNGVSGFYLRGTTLQLYSSAPSNTNQQTHILNQDSSFVFENGVWKNSITGGITLTPGSGLGIVAAFLAARPNINAENYSLALSNQQQVLIVESFISYMSNYNAWEAAGFPKGKGTLQEYLQDVVQSNMMHVVQGLYDNSSGHYPTNNVIWPPF